MDRQLLQRNLSNSRSDKGNNVSGFLIIIMLVYFIIHSTDIYDLEKDNFFKKPLFMIILGTVLLFSTIGSMIYYYYKKTSNGLLGWFLISIIIIITGVIYKSFKAEDIMKDEDDNIYQNFKEQNQLSTLIPLILFTISGVVSYMVISNNDKCEGPMCSKLYIATFTILMYGIYYVINIFKQFSNVGFINDYKEKKGKKSRKDEKSMNINKSYNLIAVIILCIWQFYILMISDVFRFSNIHKRQYRGVISDLNSKDSLKYLIYMSFVYIIFSFIVNTIGTVNCEKWKNVDKVNNIKEIQANIIVSAVITLLLINTV